MMGDGIAYTCLPGNVIISRVFLDYMIYNVGAYASYTRKWWKSKV